jgi:spore coat polysaccharide biosynthesis protein SpsF
VTAAARAVIVLQARTGSQRLPGKVLAPIASFPLVEYCLARLVAADVGPVVLATTALEADRVLVDLGTARGVQTYAGPVDDVLARYVAAADLYPEARYVLRATADNPFVDIDAPGRVLKALSAGADYAVEEALPMGTAVEGVRREALLQAQREAGTPYDREHVTPWVRRANCLTRVTPLAPVDVRAPELRLTVDTPEDLAYVRRLASALTATGRDPRLVPLRDVIALARSWPAREVA